MKINPAPGYAVIRLVKPKKMGVTKKGLYIPGHGEIHSSQAGFKPYGEVIAVNWEGHDPVTEQTFQVGDMVAFQRGVLNPVALRQPGADPNIAPDLVIGNDQIVAVLTDLNIDFERGV